MKKKTKKRKNTKKRKKFNRLSLFVSLIILIGAGVAVAANGVASSGFEANAIAEKIEQLQEENKKLEFTAAKSRSIKNVYESNVIQQDLVPIQNLKHILKPGE